MLKRKNAQFPGSLNSRLLKRRKGRRKGGVCWQTTLLGRFLEVEAQRELGDSRAIDVSSGLPELGWIPENIAHRNIEVRVVEEIEEVSLELQRHPLRRAELLCHTEVRVDKCRTPQGVPARWTIAEQAKVDRSRAHITAEG